MIAPLLLLTFIENAFKHGVKPSLNQTKIDISLVTKREAIIFQIQNSIPPLTTMEKEKQGIGFKNVKRQLNLLYPNTHDLVITTTKNNFMVKLTIHIQHVNEIPSEIN